MKKNVKRIIPILILIPVICTLLFTAIFHNKKNISNSLVKVNIEEILKTEAYSYLPEEAKNYIRDVYSETGQILPTEKNKIGNQSYLNPEYVDYLTDEEKYQTIIPKSTRFDFVPVGSTGGEDLPESFDLRNVDGKNYVTPFKNQGSEGLCWDFAATAHLESFLLYKANKEYDENAEIFSEKQIDYATAYNASSLENGIYQPYRSLGSAGNYNLFEEILMDGLGAVYSSWNQEHANEVFTNSFLDRSDIFNFENSNYELNATAESPYIYQPTATEDEKEQYLYYLKSLIKQNGGAYVSISNNNIKTYNYYGPLESEYAEGYNNWVPVTLIALDSNFNSGDQGHALEVIGWDDNITYKTCSNYRSQKIYSNQNSCENNDTYHEGKGVWILKNSWGADNRDRIVYLAYDSLNPQMWFIRELGKRNWDNFYELQVKEKDFYSGEEYEDEYYFKNYFENNNEKLNKIKLHLDNGSYEILISQDNGETYNSIKTFQVEYTGITTIDFSSSNITINNNTSFKLISHNDYLGYVSYFKVYTNNLDETKKIYTKDVEYNNNDEILTSKDERSILITSKTKNIISKTNLIIKLKDSNNNYIDDNFYRVKYNKVYANNNIAELIIKTDKIKSGNYVIEVCDSNNNCSTANLNIESDFIKTLGDGSSSNPWQITNATQFNLIRKNFKDHYIIMNDIDFEYDTQNPEGKLYNDGKGFLPIDFFEGCIDGNNHKLKNIYINNASASLINSITINNNACGIKNIQIYNPTYIGEYDASGIATFVNIAYYNDSPLINTSVVGGTIKTIKKDNTYYYDSLAAGLYQRINLNGLNEYTISNIYNSATIEVENGINNKAYALIGNISNYSYMETNININNAMNAGNIICDDCHKGLVGTDEETSRVNLNNIISINNPTLPIVDYDYIYNVKVNFNNVFSTSSYLINTDTEWNSSNNVLLNKKTVEIANANYSNWEAFNNNWFQYNQDGVQRIPVLKNIEYDYFKPDQTIISLDINESLDLSTIFANSSIMESCTYNVPACVNETDNSILRLEGNTITGLKKGSTKIIIANEHDGYIKAIDVKVGSINLVKFDANGGTGTMREQEFTPLTAMKINKNTFTNGNHTFDHWNTKADDTGTKYSDEQEIEVNEDMTLYAIWNYRRYNVKYDANGGSGIIPDQIFTDGEAQKLTKNIFEKEPYLFDHWNTKADDTGTSYNDEQEIEITKDMTLYAIYRLADYKTITFESNGGEYVPPLYIEPGTTVELPKPNKDGYLFGGWHSDQELNHYYWSNEITEDIKLYAAWYGIYVEYDLNGGTAKEGYKLTSDDYRIGQVIELKSPEEMGIIPPEGKKLESYIIYNGRFLEGQKFTVPEEMEGLYIKCTWKDIDDNSSENIEEEYELTFNTQYEYTSSLDPFVDINQKVASEKQIFDTMINDFKEGKEKVTVANYDDLFDSNHYSIIRGFRLIDTEVEGNKKIYKYEVKCNRVTLEQANKAESKYNLVKAEEVDSIMSNSVNIPEYIQTKKNELLEQVKDVNVDDLFVADEENNIYQFAELINTEPTSIIYKTDFEKYVVNYNVNYKLIKISLVGQKEYTLTSADSTISFTEDENQEFEFTIEDLINSTDEFIKEKISKAKEKIDGDKNLIGYYKIEIKKGTDNLHEGPFNLKIKLSEEQKKYNKYYMIYNSEEDEEEPIEFIRDGDYLVGTLQHLSEYSLVGEGEAPIEEQTGEQKKDDDNPNTFDNIIGYLLIASAISLLVLYSRKKLHIRKYE